MVGVMFLKELAWAHGEHVMSTKTFGEKLRKLRDGDLTPQDSWIFRYAGITHGVAVTVWALKSLDKIEFDDIAWMLLEAVRDPFSTSIHICFTKKSSGNVVANLTEIINTLTKSGFKPYIPKTMTDVDGVGWLYFPLFTKDDLPKDPIRVDKNRMN